jgi:hypothetical protein
MNALVVLRHAYDRISHEPVLLSMELGITDWTFPDQVSFRRNILPSPSSFGKHYTVTLFEESTAPGKGAAMSFMNSLGGVQP